MQCNHYGIIIPLNIILVFLKLLNQFCCRTFTQQLLGWLLWVCFFFPFGIF
jgi:hypothetical protein